MGKVAITHIQNIDFDAESGISTFDINIETGRKHQIRKHLSGIGCHIINDRLYGQSNSPKDSPEKFTAFRGIARFRLPSWTIAPKVFNYLKRFSQTTLHRQLPIR